MIKQVIVMRKKFIGADGKSFSMRKGKEKAQASHASMAFITRRLEGQITGEYWVQSGDPILLTRAMGEWLNNSFTKISLVCDTEEELVAIYDAAKAAGLEVHMVTDSGATEFHGVATRTCLAIGPDHAEKIDPITRHLKTD